MKIRVHYRNGEPEDFADCKTGSPEEIAGRIFQAHGQAREYSRAEVLSSASSATPAGVPGKQRKRKRRK